MNETAVDKQMSMAVFGIGAVLLGMMNCLIDGGF